MNTDYTSASKDWWQKHSDELKEWNWESFCKVWAAAADSVIPPVQHSPKFRFLKDVEIYAVVHKAGEIRPIDSYDKVTDTEIQWCIGHGMLYPLRIGDDVELI